MPSAFRPAIVLHGILALAAFGVTLAWSARGDGLMQPAIADDAAPATITRPAAPVVGKDALEHGEAVYRTRRYAEAEDALRCAGFRNMGPTRTSSMVSGKDYEVTPHPAVRHAAEVDLPRQGSGANLCAHLRQVPVREWYRERFGG